MAQRCLLCPSQMPLIHHNLIHCGCFISSVKCLQETAVESYVRMVRGNDCESGWRTSQSLENVNSCQEHE
uniref:Uncharacterized protein n=1 Tax=Physcomitrium patens TaxID=3218 RepID=A0A2K1KKV0_PHYPA|nr:hypothetical protein PHYPA_008074 [Physcomitrium patens]